MDRRELSRDGYIQSLTTNEDGGNIDQQVLRGDIVWDAPKNCLPLQLPERQERFTEPRVQDAMFRTFDDPNPDWVKSIIGLPEMYTYVGTDYRGQPVEPFFVPQNQVAGYPGRSSRRVGEPFRHDAAERLRHRAGSRSRRTGQLTDNLALQFLTAQTNQDADSVVDWDNSQYDLVLDMNRSELEVFSQEMQITGGRDRFEWLAGVYYWDQETPPQRPLAGQRVPEGVDGPDNVFNNAVCNPAGAVLEPTPSRRRIRTTCASQPGTSAS